VLTQEKADALKSFQDCQSHLAEVEKVNINLQERAKLAAADLEKMK
jgi:hypothetical protein